MKLNNTNPCSYTAEFKNLFHRLYTFLKYKNIKELNRGIVVELIDTIHLHKDGQITIDFRFGDEFRRVADFIENNCNDLTIVDTEAV